MNNNDIVERLREEGFITHMARLPRESKILHAAADEIERLRKENNDLKEIVALQGEVVKLAQKRHKERDEARREVCEADTDTHGGALLEAERRGWDCFKEVSNEQ